MNLARLVTLMITLITVAGFTTATISGAVAAQTDPIAEDSVQLGGSSVTIDGSGASAIGVRGLPQGYFDELDASDIDEGTLQSGDNGIIWTTGGVKTITLTPPNTASAGDTVTFEVKIGSQDPQSVTLEVKADSTSDSSETDSEADSTSDSSETDSEADSTSDSSETDSEADNTEGSNDSVPGLGIGSGIAAFGVFSYLLKRRLIDNSN